MRQQGRTSPRTPYTTEYRNRRGFAQTMERLVSRVTGVELRAVSTAPVAGDAFGLEVRQDGVYVGTRSIIDFLTGANVTLTSSDDGTAVSVEIASTGGGGGAPSGPAGGELSGTYPNPSVAVSHSGSTHAATQAAAEATAASALAGHVAAADPHAGYRLESADHSHATTGLQGGTVAHSALTGIGADDHHAQSHSHASHTGIGTDDHHAQSHAIGSHTGGTAVLVADAAWIDLTDGGATTLHSHAGGGSVATDAIWDAAGDLAVGTGPDAAARLAIGGASTLLSSNGTTASWQGTPQITGFADTGGTTRLLFATTASPGPNLTMTGGVRVNGTIGINIAPTAGTYILIQDIAANNDGKAGLVANIGIAATPAASQVYGVIGRAVANDGALTTTIAGLSFYAGTTGTSWNGVTLAVVAATELRLNATSSVSHVITDFYGVQLLTPIVSATSLIVTRYTGMIVTGVNSSKIQTATGYKYTTFTNAGTINVPLDLDGPARTTNNDGSFHRMNLQLFGPRAFGTGDGVLGIANATTNPSTNPAAGGVLYANAGAGTWRGSGGTVTAFGPAGPHCGNCGQDAWTVAMRNEVWKSWLYICGRCGARYEGGPRNVLPLLTREQRREVLRPAMSWDDLMLAVA